MPKIDEPMPLQEPREGDPDPARPDTRAPAAKAPSSTAGKVEAVRCDLAGPGYFPAGDPRAGHYEPGRIYRVGEHVTADQAEALIAGGFFAAVPSKEG